jgi:hypothetical protein
MDHLSLSRKRLAIYTRHFGQPGQIVEDAAEGNPRVDVIVYPPQGSRSFTTLITSGMSDMRMSLPESIPPHERSDFYRRELIWYVSEQKREYVTWMQWLGHFPFIDRTWLGHGHTVQWNEPLFPGSALQHFLLTYSILRNDDKIKDELKIEDDPVALLWINPITPQEHRVKKEMRIDGLLDLFERNKHPFIFDSGRSSYA